MLFLNGLDFDYQDEPLLRHVSFKLPVGGLLHLRGANGAGKTTLLKLIAGLYHPISGEILFSGTSIAENLADYQKKLCFVGHKSGLNPYLTVQENLFFDLHFGLHEKNCAELISVFQLEHLMDKPCGLLSAGQRRQVSLLRLWMTNAPLWLLDEPLVALDDRALEILMNKIKVHRQQGGAVLLTSHQNLPLNTSDYLEYRL